MLFVEQIDQVIPLIPGYGLSVRVGVSHPWIHFGNFHVTGSVKVSHQDRTIEQIALLCHLQQIFLLHVLNAGGSAEHIPLHVRMSHIRGLPFTGEQRLFQVQPLAVLDREANKLRAVRRIIHKRLAIFVGPRMEMAGVGSITGIHHPAEVVDEPPRLRASLIAASLPMSAMSPGRFKADRDVQLLAGHGVCTTLVDGIAVFFFAKEAYEAGHALRQSISHLSFTVDHHMHKVLHEINAAEIDLHSKVEVIQKPLLLAHGQPCHIPEDQIPFIQTVFNAHVADRRSHRNIRFPEPHGIAGIRFQQEGQVRIFFIYLRCCCIRIVSHFALVFSGPFLTLGVDKEPVSISAIVLISNSKHLHAFCFLRDLFTVFKGAVGIKVTGNTRLIAAEAVADLGTVRPSGQLRVAAEEGSEVAVRHDRIVCHSRVSKPFPHLQNLQRITDGYGAGAMDADSFQILGAPYGTEA